MAAYAIAQVHVTQESRYAEYLERVPDTIRKYGGRYVVRGGRADHFGEANPYERMVVIEFPDRTAAEQWIQSPEYAETSRYGEEACHGVLSIVDGVEDDAGADRLAKRLAWAEGVALHSWIFG